MTDDVIFVGGAWRRGRGEPLDSVNPADGSLNATLNAASPADVDDAVQAGQRAWREPSWRSLLPHQRARVLTRIGDRIQDAADEIAADEIAAVQTRDTGKTLRETKALALSAADTFRYTAAALETLEETLTPSRGPYLTFSVHEPIGVIGAITPWNSPIASDAQKVAPALAAGNAVVLKPAEWTPLVSLLLARLCEEAGLPAGLLSVLPGAGGVVGDAIVKHPGVGKVVFTGGTATGRVIAGHAAAKLMPVSLELGGKSPTIILPDADVDQAVAGVAFGVFSSTGQSCIAGSRLFVHSSIYQQVVDRLVQVTRDLKVGLPTDPATQVAPMVAFAHRDRVAGYVDLARQEGAQVLCGGDAPSGGAYDRGAFYLPTILAGLSNTARVCQEEIFGPVLVVMPFDDEEHLVAQANDSVYGLAAGIWTRDLARAWRLGRALEAGTIWVNTYKQFSISTPFGGFKDSGLGREKGRTGILGYMQQKSFYLGLDSDPLPWAGLTATASEAGATTGRVDLPTGRPM